MGIWACGLVQKKVHDTSKSLEDTGWPFGDRLWLAVVRGGPGSPASRGLVVPAPIWLGFWYWSNNVARQNYLGAQIGMASNGAEPPPRYGGAVKLRRGNLHGTEGET